MKTTTILSTITALASMAAATPGKGYRVSKARDVDVTSATEMTFTGPISPGGPNVTLTGTAESIHNQLLKKNPDYNPWAFPEHRERMGAMGITEENQHKYLKDHHLARRDTLSKRDSIECEPNGSQVGNYITQCAEGVGYLQDLNGDCGAPAGRGGCARVSCSQNCGIFLCNDNTHDIKVPCATIAGDFLDIADECGVEYDDFVISLKGQAFRDASPVWNTVVKSQDC